jgi:hypothetical protein
MVIIMRKFYIFNINQEFTTLTKTSPYNLFKAFEDLYYLPKIDTNNGYDLYQNLTTPINRLNLNNKLFNYYKEDDHYSKFMNTHFYNNFYSDEITKLTINNAYMILETTALKPTFLPKLSSNKSLFACDFQNKDYFWLESIA